MGRLISYKPHDQSLLYFAKYIYLRYKEGKPLSEEEGYNFYDVYIQWAAATDYNYFHKIVFYRYIKRYGFYSDYAYDKTKRTMRHFFQPNLEELKAILMQLEEGFPDVSYHYCKIGGQKYKVTTTYEAVK